MGSGGQHVCSGQGGSDPREQVLSPARGSLPSDGRARAGAGQGWLRQDVPVSHVCRGKAGARLGPGEWDPQAAPRQQPLLPAPLSEATHACAAQPRAAACPVPVQPPLRPRSRPLLAPALPCRGASAGPGRLWGHCWTPEWCHRAGVQGRTAQRCRAMARSVACCMARFVARSMAHFMAQSMARSLAHSVARTMADSVARSVARTPQTHIQGTLGSSRQTSLRCWQTFTGSWQPLPLAATDYRRSSW